MSLLHQIIDFPIAEWFLRILLLFLKLFFFLYTTILIVICILVVIINIIQINWFHILLSKSLFQLIFGISFYTQNLSLFRSILIFLTLDLQQLIWDFYNLDIFYNFGLATNLVTFIFFFNICLLSNRRVAYLVTLAFVQFCVLIASLHWAFWVNQHTLNRPLNRAVISLRRVIAYHLFVVATCVWIN